ncbi:tetratricopeptide repeat protein [Streptomyces sp. MBT65]|uniref:tetratricopeptide repeat protein n=1 Tax=Streptomyces sp. MBT65 TaxID=1488395 RepID=UPI00190D2C9E|nr:tetratricopeptide repeat protein [Streptomyces sp. MBT65]MBK3576644.1 tetratricopeptide repeat protein [Streptomyces sp. MBT65]
MTRLSREKKREQKRAARSAPAASPFEVRVPVDGPGAGGASIGGVPVPVPPGEEIQHVVLSHLHRIATATGHPVHATIHDARIGYVVPLQIDPDGSSHFSAEPWAMPGAGTAPVGGTAPFEPSPPPPPALPPAVPAPQDAPAAPAAVVEPEREPDDLRRPSGDPATHRLRAVAAPEGEVVPTFPLRAVPESAGESAPTFPLHAVPESAQGGAPLGSVQPPTGAFGPPPVMDSAPVRDVPPFVDAGPVADVPPVMDGRPVADVPPFIDARPVVADVPDTAYASDPAFAPDPPYASDPAFAPDPAYGSAPVPHAPRTPERAPRPAPIPDLALTAPEPDPKPTPARGFDAVAEAVLGDEPVTTDGAGTAFLVEPMVRINEAVKAGRIEEAVGLAERTVADAAGALGPEHSEVLRLRELAAYIAYLAGDPVHSFRLSLDLARIRHRARDAEAAYGNVQSAATAWRAVRDPEQGLALGRDLIDLWTELAAEDGPAVEDIEQLESARARMGRLTERARRAND